MSSTVGQQAMSRPLYETGVTTNQTDWLVNLKRVNMEQLAFFSYRKAFHFFFNLLLASNREPEKKPTTYNEYLRASSSSMIAA